MYPQASLSKRLASLIYELLMLIAMSMLVVFVYVMIFGNADTAVKRIGLQWSIWLVVGVYFVRCWTADGQTLAAHTWKIRLLDQHQQRLTLKLALLRYALASLSLLAFGAGFLWALVDRERQFLHDRLLATRYVQCANDAQP